MTLKKQIPEEKLFESMGRRFTVTLLKPDFTVLINNKAVTEEVALPNFEFRFPEQGYTTETISIKGKNREIKYWCGFVGKAEWSQDESGVGIYAHGKIAQDRPFVFGAKGLEITTRYMYAVIEADWVDELPTEFISTDRTSINWEDDETQDFYQWGGQTVKKWAKKFQDEKNKKNDKVVEKKLNNPELEHITSTEKKAIKEIVTEMSPKVTNDDQLQNEVISKLTSAWLHEPSRIMINTLWDRLKSAEKNHDEFINTLNDIHQHLVPESLSLSTVTAQRIYALSRLERLAINGIEEELQVLLEQFPWVLNTEKNFTANQSLKEFAKIASTGDQINAHGTTKKDLKNQPDEGTRPDFAFFSTEEDSNIMVVELKSPQVMLEHAHLNQLQTYMNWIKDHYSSSKVTGYLIGSGASNINCNDSDITIKDWSKLCLENRRNYVEQLAAMIKGAYDIASPERVYKSIEFAGSEALELLSRMNDANPDFKDFMNKIEKLIEAKATKKGKKL